MKKILALLSFAITTSGFAQKINNQLHFQKGQKLEMVLTVNTTSQGIGDSKADITITRHFDVNDVSNGNAVIEHKVKRMQLNFVSPMFGAKTFDSEKESDMKGEGGKEVEKSMKNKYTMTLDASGKVTAVKKDDDNPNDKDSVSMDMMDNLIAQVSAGLSVPAIGDKTDFAILPDREVGKGDSWTDSSQNKKTVYTLAELTENEVLINFTEDATIETKQEIMGNTVTISSKEKTTGKLTLDRKTGLLKEKSSSTNSEGTLQAMGQSMPMNSKSVRNWVVKNG